MHVDLRRLHLEQASGQSATIVDTIGKGVEQLIS
jgi:hypothetical protein